MLDFAASIHSFRHLIRSTNLQEKITSEARVKITTSCFHKARKIFRSDIHIPEVSSVQVLQVTSYTIPLRHGSIVIPFSIRNKRIQLCFESVASLRCAPFSQNSLRSA